MRVDITHPIVANGEIVLLPEHPPDVPPPIDINDFFELEELRVSGTELRPFQEIEITWSIRPIADASFSDFTFSLTANGENVAVDIDTQGSERVVLYTDTLVNIHVRRPGGSANFFILGDGIIVRVDDSSCDKIPLPGQVFDELFIDNVEGALSDLSTSDFTLRRRKMAVPHQEEPGSGGQPPGPQLPGRQPPRTQYDRVEMDVEITYETGVIKYYFPLEVVVPNFFNADLDLRLELRTWVSHERDKTHMEVRLDHSTEMIYSTFQEIVSFGNAATAAALANQLIPRIVACHIPNSEKKIAAEFCKVIGKKRLLTHRLQDIYIGTAISNLGVILFTMCPKHYAPPIEPLER